MGDRVSRMRLVLLGLAVAATLCAQEAQATFAVCNKAKHAANVAFGRFNGTDWMSEGWWTVAAGKCARLLADPLDARYYYLFADDGGSGTWDGGTDFCTTSAPKFSIVGRQSCASRGFDRRGFFRIDTGQAPNWTQSLSD
jgi:uncharacterized membrane protein